MNEILKIVRGNDFILKVEVKTWHMAGDTPQEEKPDLSRCSALQVNAVSTDCGCKRAMTYAMVQGVKNILLVKFGANDFDSDTTLGIEVTGHINGRQFRSYEKRILKIVENNGKSNVMPEVYEGECSYQTDLSAQMWTEPYYPVFYTDPDTGIETGLIFASDSICKQAVNELT